MTNHKPPIYRIPWAGLMAGVACWLALALLIYLPDVITWIKQ